MGKKYLSLGGRITLIKAVLLNLPTYYLSMFQLPKGIEKKLEQLFGNFLWGGNEAKRKVHLVAWPEVVKPKIKGGLGIVPLYLKNQALLCKWAWRFGREKDALWVKILSAK